METLIWNIAQLMAKLLRGVVVLDDFIAVELINVKKITSVLEA
jgi:hypothetical protein